MFSADSLQLIDSNQVCNLLDGKSKSANKLPLNKEVDFNFGKEICSSL